MQRATRQLSAWEAEFSILYLENGIRLPDQYPDIVFKNTNVSANAAGANQYDLKINGDLTLHGVTRQITIPRVEACDSCKHYIKGVDLIRLGFAAPLVDEIDAALLDLWAREHGYKKIELNLVGV
jgi:hypothetical protein